MLTGNQGQTLAFVLTGNEGQTPRPVLRRARPVSRTPYPWPVRVGRTLPGTVHGRTTPNTGEGTVHGRTTPNTGEGTAYGRTTPNTGAKPLHEQMASQPMNESRQTGKACAGSPSGKRASRKTGLLRQCRSKGGMMFRHMTRCAPFRAYRLKTENSRLTGQPNAKRLASKLE